MIAEGRNINVTLIFSLERYQRGDGGLPRRARGVRRRPTAPTCRRWPASASFFITRVDTEVDRRLDAIGTPEALGAARQGAPSPRASWPTSCSGETFSGPRWEALAAQGARVQRPLWASTSTKNPAYPDTLYVDELIGPDTVNTLPDATIEAFADHGTLARTRRRRRRRGRGASGQGLADVGVDIDDVADHARARGRRQLPEELRRAARRPRRQGRRAPRPGLTADRSFLCQETRRLRSFFLTQNGIRRSAPDGAGAAGTRAGGDASAASLRSLRRCRRR